MLIVPRSVEVGYLRGVALGVLAKELGYTRVQLRGWYRALDHRAVRLAEKVKAAGARERAECLAQVGVKRALRDDDKAGCSLDYPLEGLRRWGTTGVPGCFGIARGDGD